MLKASFESINGFGCPHDVRARIGQRCCRPEGQCCILEENRLLTLKIPRARATANVGFRDYHGTSHNPHCEGRPRPALRRGNAGDISANSARPREIGHDLRWSSYGCDCREGNKDNNFRLHDTSVRVEISQCVLGNCALTIGLSQSVCAPSAGFQSQRKTKT